jgi:hypothetical protein
MEQAFGPRAKGGDPDNWLNALLDVILSGGPLDQEGELRSGAAQIPVEDAYRAFAGGPENFFRGAQLGRATFEPGPIQPSFGDQAMGAIAALLANKWNQRKAPPLGGSEGGDPATETVPGGDGTLII